LLVKKLTLLLGALLLGSVVSSFGASLVVTFDSGSAILRDSQLNPLTAGTTADGDGAVIQLGYYSQATAANNFLGTWVPLSGQGSLNTGPVDGSSPSIGYNQTSIGDINASADGAGTFALSLTFTTGSATIGNSLPGSTSIPLAIRFYNGTSIANSTEFNVVSADQWLWQTPSDNPPLVTISLSESNLEWLGGAASAFKTAVPEPSTAVLAMMSGCALILRRRRRN